MVHRVIRKEKIEVACNSVEPSAKKSVLFSGAWDGKYAVAAVVIDGIKPKAEVHEHAADVWRVEKGTGKFVLGGTLVSPETVREGELVADAIEGGETFDVAPGDVIDIPPGVAHQIDATGGRIELLIIKVNVV